jgi:hypothetical protein
VGDLSNISEAHGASIIRVEVCRMASCHVWHYVLNRNGGREERVRIGASSRPVGTVEWESCAHGSFKDPGMHQKSPRPTCKHV